MDRNVGGIDRTVRLVVGPLLLAVGVAIAAGIVSVGPSGLALAALAMLLGVVALGTALTQRCLCNKLLGIDTS